MRDQRISRRKFVAAAAAAPLAFTYIPRRVWGANERFYVAGIGVGGKGAGEVSDVTRAGGTFVALCDVDEKRGGGSFKKHPDAKRYTDFRVMLEQEKGIDAVTVSTPDHIHAPAAVMAMAMGKHVYCQKPLTYSIQEARVMAKMAAHHKVATQMGNQAHAGEPIRRAVELVRAGIIGPVREVHAWTNRPIWPQGQKALDQRDAQAGRQAPDGLDWDLWLGPAPERPYNPVYLPFNWRGWWDYGTGALGDMACHIMDMPYWALDLGAPLTVEAECGGITAETAPDWSRIEYRFPARKSVGGGELGAAVGPRAAVEQPPVKFVWYDGKKDGKQNAPYDLLEQASEEARAAQKREEETAGAGEEAAQGERRSNRRGRDNLATPGRWDMVLVGDKGMMLFRRSSTDWIVTPGARAEEFAETPKTVRRVKNEDVEWIEACKGGPKALSSFDYAGPFSEMVILGTVALRVGKKIEWDAKAMKATNAPEADQYITRKYRKGWDLAVSSGIKTVI